MIIFSMGGWDCFNFSMTSYTGHFTDIALSNTPKSHWPQYKDSQTDPESTNTITKFNSQKRPEMGFRLSHLTLCIYVVNVSFIAKVAVYLEIY